MEVIIENDGDFPELVHGKYRCSGVLWNDEHLKIFCYLEGLTPTKELDEWLHKNLELSIKS